MPRAVLVLLVALAGCGGDTDPGTDLETGLRFTLSANRLEVEATRRMPAGVRTRLEGRDVLATCDVPGADVATLPKPWDDLDEPFVTMLLTRRPVDVERAATRCRLEVDGRTFSEADV